MATEVEQLYLQLEHINIKKQMLILQMLKRWHREHVCGGGMYDRSRLGTGEFTTLVVNSLV